MTSKERYQYYKDNEICVRCHKAKAEQGKLFCKVCIEKRKQYQKQYDKEDYEYFKSKGICTHCHSEKVRNGHSLCFRCLAEKNEKYKPDGRNRNEYVKERYKRNKENGICVMCGKKQATVGVFCLECSIKHTRLEKQRRIEKGITPKILFGDGEHCSWCGKPTQNGDKLCKRCYENSLQSIKKARDKMPKDNYFKKLHYSWWNTKNGR